MSMNYDPFTIREGSPPEPSANVASKVSPPQHLGFRPDIQGLRAIAVLLVLVFHVFPHTLPGGYVGVDVFFVISGFLISGLLMKENTKNGRISLLRFYERRVRRLMPAATLVLVASAVGTILFLPQLRWIDTAWQLLASAFYGENWYLYFQSVDYLRADTPPSPFQHYWSLSIEEQFYFAWPLLIMLSGALAARVTGRPKLIWGLVFATVFGVSLALSVMVTQRSQAAAYFMTWTRVWELALGGLVALLVGQKAVIPGPVRSVILWAALAVVIASAAIFTEVSPFPGYIALVPTLATGVLLLMGEKGGMLSSSTLMRTPVMQFFGDVSYSLYLWHWPAVVFGMAYLGRHFTALEGLGIMAMAMLASALTKQYVEDLFRNRSEGGSSLRVVAMFVLCAAASIGAAAAIYVPASRAVAASSSRIIVDTDYPGAAALFAGADVPVPDGPAFIPELVIARNSLPDMYERRCHVARPDAEIIPCVFAPPEGAPQSGKTVMLIGDSHAGHWLPALQEIAAERGFTIITHTKSSCPYLDADLIVASTVYPECRVWMEAVREDVLATQPDLVITAMVTNHFAVGAQSQPDNQRRLADGLKAAWQPLADAGIPIVAMAGTPAMERPVPECLGENEDTPDVCGGQYEDVLGRDGAIRTAAAEMADTVTLVDMNDGLCTTRYCSPIVGNVVVYRDQNHLTTVYAKTLSPLLEERLHGAGQLP